MEDTDPDWEAQCHSSNVSAKLLIELQPAVLSFCIPSNQFRQGLSVYCKETLVSV